MDKTPKDPSEKKARKPKTELESKSFKDGAIYLFKRAAKIWRAGLGRKDKGGETIEDERGLTVQEVKALDELYVWIMERRKDKRGYIISTSGR